MSAEIHTSTHQTTIATGKKVAYDRNREIAEFVKGKAASGIPYSQEELAYVNTYVGFGGMWNLDSSLQKERGLYEYYTPAAVVSKMVGLAYAHGYSGGPVLEPSCGIGRFLHYFDPKEQVTGIELDEISFLIAQANFPHYDIRHQSFNELFVDRRGKTVPYNPVYELVIGNPPYGAFSGKGTTTERTLTKAQTYVDYFISRSLDLMRPGALLIFIIPSAFIEGSESKGKTLILEKARLIDAYRLPKRIFDQTDIQTDIVVFQKR